MRFGKPNSSHHLRLFAVSVCNKKFIQFRIPWFCHKVCIRLEKDIWFFLPHIEKKSKMTFVVYNQTRNKIFYMASYITLRNTLRSC